MTGRIKLLMNGAKVNEEDVPKIEYTYNEQGVFDESCGTFGLDAFTLPRSFCPKAFICETDDASEAMQAFSGCISAMDCSMFSGMTTNMVAGSAQALFMHQMIPHHQNAVNMAKVLLHSGSLDCDDVGEETDDCLLYVMMLSIINVQNFQIQTMKSLLANNPDYPDEDNCELNITEQDYVQQKSSIAANQNERTVKVNYFVGKLGYFQFEECGDLVNPTLGMEVGETYTFVQADVTNYFHPMGFAYFPDGAHDDVDELEPGITQTQGNACTSDNTCSAPMYFIGDEYLGTYSNIPEVETVTTGDDDFGLDKYEPLFFHPFADWMGYGNFSVKLRFTDVDFSHDIFYFCHVRQTTSF
jgi:hypothetical protein